MQNRVTTSKHSLPVEQARVLNRSGGTATSISKANVGLQLPGKHGREEVDLEKGYKDTLLLPNCFVANKVFAESDQVNTYDKDVRAFLGDDANVTRVKTDKWCVVRYFEMRKELEKKHGNPSLMEKREAYAKSGIKHMVNECSCCPRVKIVFDQDGLRHDLTDLTTMRKINLEMGWTVSSIAESFPGPIDGLMIEELLVRRPSGESHVIKPKCLVYVDIDMRKKGDIKITKPGMLKAIRMSDHVPNQDALYPHWLYLVMYDTFNDVRFIYYSLEDQQPSQRVTVCRKFLQIDCKPRPREFSGFDPKEKFPTKPLDWENIDDGCACCPLAIGSTRDGCYVSSDCDVRSIPELVSLVNGVPFEHPRNRSVSPEEQLITTVFTDQERKSFMVIQGSVPAIDNDDIAKRMGNSVRNGDIENPFDQAFKDASKTLATFDEKTATKASENAEQDQSNDADDEQDEELDPLEKAKLKPIDIERFEQLVKDDIIVADDPWALLWSGKIGFQDNIRTIPYEPAGVDCDDIKTDDVLIGLPSNKALLYDIKQEEIYSKTMMKKINESDGSVSDGGFKKSVTFTFPDEVISSKSKESDDESLDLDDIDFKSDTSSVGEEMATDEFITSSYPVSDPWFALKDKEDNVGWTNILPLMLPLPIKFECDQHSVCVIPDGNRYNDDCVQESMDSYGIPEDHTIEWIRREQNIHMNSFQRIKSIIKDVFDIMTGLSDYKVSPLLAGMVPVEDYKHFFKAYRAYRLALDPLNAMIAACNFTRAQGRNLEDRTFEEKYGNLFPNTQVTMGRGDYFAVAHYLPGGKSMKSDGLVKFETDRCRFRLQGSRCPEMDTYCCEGKSDGCTQNDEFGDIGYFWCAKSTSNSTCVKIDDKWWEMPKVFNHEHWRRFIKNLVYLKDIPNRLIGTITLCNCKARCDDNWCKTGFTFESPVDFYTLPLKYANSPWFDVYKPVQTKYSCYPEYSYDELKQ